VGNIDLKSLLDFHKSHGKLATVTAVRPPSRFGSMEFDQNRVVEFREKPQTEGGWINGGFFVLEPGIFDYIKDDEVAWESDPLRRIASDGQLMAYRHEAFWQPMDTVREKLLLQALWDSGEAPWKVW
jgi:glucose-1-phosphate cytidylyltransferase